MIHDGIKCKRSKVFGWRSGNPETDLDFNGQPVKENYVVIVRIADCPVEKSLRSGREYYKPEGVQQAFPITHGGTYYGYAKSKIVRNGPGRHVRVRVFNSTQYEWLRTYVKTPIYVVQDGAVYVGATYRELKAGEK